MDTNETSIIIAILGSIVLVLGLGSRWLAQSSMPPTLLGLLVGILIGPEVLGIFDISTLGDKSKILETVARLTLAIGLMSVALRVPKNYLWQNWKSMTILVFFGMVMMWVISSVLIYWIIGVSFWQAALIGAIVAPTDPIAATPIVTGPLAEEKLPDRLKHAISFESGANDGLSYLFVFLPLLMLSHTNEQALTEWLSKTLLWEVVVATLFGLLLGYIAAKLLLWSEKNNLILENWRLVYTVALALLCVGFGKLINSDEVLLVFAAGVTFVQVVSSEERGEEEKGQEAVNRFFSIPIFALLGTVIPWAGWASLGWSGVLLVISILLLRRPPVLLLLRYFIPVLRSNKDALFLGWFGPVAVAAIYYASLAERHLHNTLIWDVVSLVICSSVVVHGITAAPFTRIFGLKANKQQE